MPVKFEDLKPEMIIYIGFNPDPAVEKTTQAQIIEHDKSNCIKFHVLNGAWTGFMFPDPSSSPLDSNHLVCTHHLEKNPFPIFIGDPVPSSMIYST